MAPRSPLQCPSCNATVAPGERSCSACGVPFTVDGSKRWVVWVALAAAGCLVAILALGVLATLVMPRVSENLDRAKAAKARADLARLRAAVDEHAIRHGGEPPEALEELLAADEHGEPTLRARDLFDPWGRAYGYERASTRVWSSGPDGLEGTADDIAVGGSR